MMEGSTPSKKALYARGRPRDERGKFLPVEHSRRARIRAARAVPAALAGLVGEDDAVQGAIARTFGRGAIPTRHHGLGDGAGV